ncbi:MAG TPA: DUF4272 domain-containing protein [Campylobacterales bacterium]|nr:DUF4272 domain-containing protein [Campylobacterales bacterium]
MEEKKIIAPSAERVAKRAMVLSALVCRGFIEVESPADVEELRASLLPWLDMLGAREEMEKDELIALTAPLGGLDAQAQINLAWAVEGLAVLAWAMQRYELHADDTLAEPQSITNTMIFLHESAKALVDEPTLRESKELQAMKEQCYTKQCQIKEFASNPINVDKVGEKEFRITSSISRERMRASLWLLGSCELYSEVNISI